MDPFKKEKGSVFTTINSSFGTRKVKYMVIENFIRKILKLE